MKKLFLYFTLFALVSCYKKYDAIDAQDVEKLTIEDTLVNNDKVLILKVVRPISGYPQVLVQFKPSENNDCYLFEDDCRLENDSIIHSYYPAFITDSEGEFRKNGIWVYTKFYTKGTFPFHSNVIDFSVDSVPKNWNRISPTKEGIYFYENGALKRISAQQSEEQFKEHKKNGFYFFPNSGRLYDKININRLD